ncbi:MAG: rod shape-determining protein MreD [Gammaproteobacteria bacterium]|nr:rod shape-determining protein MreD [Gammaproteobacteria bacterium]MBU6509250.1 rod shape-determining protein MreD [Gammaproteobacteria bacterium]MDE1983191.1 rod shape-determining protein MreD [Gammaproteobacteria bacterium]MDE2107704.1 rod shape-determining protein MreD [Gammaproteobacteria bacterium]MDE2459637.1 rod shape-determining protein MreD [Gammaproteobacteria bacterium]
MNFVLRRRANWVIVVTYLVALLLSIWPLPDWAEAFRPAWLLLATIYWCLFLPHRVGLLVTFGVGILLDALTGSLLGEHALALLLIAWVTLKLHLQIRVFPWWQQMLVVFLLSLLYSFVLYWVDGMLGYTQGALLRWMPVLITSLLWPWSMQLLGMLQQRFQVN